MPVELTSIILLVVGSSRRGRRLFNNLKITYGYFTVFQLGAFRNEKPKAPKYTRK